MKVTLQISIGIQIQTMPSDSNIKLLTTALTAIPKIPPIPGI